MPEVLYTILLLQRSFMADCSLQWDVVSIIICFYFFWSFAVSENKALCHPSSVDSLSTSAATEDHVSMGGWAARKALKVIEHVEQGKAK